MLSGFQSCLQSCLADLDPARDHGELLSVILVIILSRSRQTGACYHELLMLNNHNEEQHELLKSIGYSWHNENATNSLRLITCRRCLC